jgi:hypothetical protein
MLGMAVEAYSFEGTPLAAGETGELVRLHAITLWVRNRPTHCFLVLGLCPAFSLSAGGLLAAARV